MNNSERSIILNENIVLEEFREISLDMTGKDQIKYMSIATEAITNPDQQANILNKLFKDMQKIDSIDFGKIGDSKGDITKYIYYDQIYSVIEVLNDITEGSPTPNISSLNKLHRILLDAREDFVWGYRVNNSTIINMYRLMAMSLYELIQVCSIDCTEYLRTKLSMEITTTVKYKNSFVVKTVNSFIKMYESGEWNNLIKSFHQDPINTTATESDINLSISTGNPGDGLTKVKTLLDSFKEKHPKVFTATAILTALIAAFFIIRKLVFYYYVGLNKLRDYAKTNAAILKANIEANTDNNNTPAIEKQKKMFSKFQDIADWADFRLNKNEKNVEKALRDSNKENFTPAEISRINSNEFELI